MSFEQDIIERLDSIDWRLWAISIMLLVIFVFTPTREDIKKAVKEALEEDD